MNRPEEVFSNSSSFKLWKGNFEKNKLNMKEFSIASLKAFSCRFFPSVHSSPSLQPLALLPSVLIFFEFMSQNSRTVLRQHGTSTRASTLLPFGTVQLTELSVVSIYIASRAIEVVADLPC